MVDNKICEGTDWLKAALRSDMTSLRYCCLSNKCLKGQQWSSDLAVSCPLTKHCDIQIESTGFKTLLLLLSPLPTIHIDVADSCVLPLVFLSSLSILSGCPIINICSCYQYTKLSWVGPMEYHPYTGFHYSKLLTYLCHDYGSFSNISGMDLDESAYRRVSNFYPN